MAKQVDFFDGAQSSTTPTIGDIDASNLVQFANDAAYEAANAGSPAAGNIYYNTTDDVIRYYDAGAAAWTTVVDTDGTQTLQNKTIDGTSASGNNTVTTDADDVSYDNTSSALTATDVQAAIDEVEGRLDTAETNITNNGSASSANTADIADIRTTTGTSDGDTGMGTFSGSTISDNVSAKTALQELETALEGHGSPLDFQGTWNANTNTPDIGAIAGAGDFWIVSVAGSTNLGGITDWQVNDWAVYEGTTWYKVDNSEVVTSVNGETGAVDLELNDISDVNANSPFAYAQVKRNPNNNAYWLVDQYRRDDDNTTTGSNASVARLSNIENRFWRLNDSGLVSIDMITDSFMGDWFVMTNNTGNPVILNNETGATADQQILTGTGGPITLKDNASIYLVYDSTIGTQKWKVVGGTGGEGGVSGIITGDNSTADTTAGDWVAYADAASDTPVDGTGGSPNVTVTRTTTASEILQGAGSFELTKGAFDRQGEGTSVDIEVDKWIRGQACKVSFSYDATANFDFGNASDPVSFPSDISVFLYDVTNSNLITPSETGVFGGGLFESTFTMPATCEDVRVILHIATTNALAWDFQFDRVQVDLAPNTSLGLDATAVLSTYKNGGALGASTTIPSWTTVEEDSVGGFNSTTGVYTVQKPGNYAINFSLVVTASTGATAQILLNGSIIAEGSGNVSGNYDFISVVAPNLAYGDQITVQTNAALTAASINYGTKLGIYQISSGAQPYAPAITYIKDVKSNNVAGGTFTAGAWQTRDLNTQEGDTSFASVSSNQITLQAGKYHIEAGAPGAQIAQHKLKIRNITDSTDDIIGMSVFTANDTSFGDGGEANLSGEITITSAKVFELQHRCTATKSGNGFGVPSNFGTNEVYATVKITKVL